MQHLPVPVCQQPKVGVGSKEDHTWQHTPRACQVPAAPSASMGFELVSAGSWARHSSNDGYKHCLLSPIVLILAVLPIPWLPE